jgi:hypothetical protein
MSFSQKLVIILAAASAGALGLSSAAFAGEGGAAGSAAFTINGTGSVTGVAVSAGIGKQDAFAGAFNSATGDNTAFAMGSAGTISVNTLASMTVGTIASNDDQALGTSQANNFAATTSVQIGTKSDDEVVTIAPPALF